MKFSTSLLLLGLSLHACLALPTSNTNTTTPYECMTGDACRSQSSGSCTRFQGQLSCCQSGDEITFSYSRPGSFFSSSFLGPCPTLGQPGNETTQELGQGGSASVKVMESGSGGEGLAYNCTCQAASSVQTYWAMHQRAAAVFEAIMEEWRNTFDRLMSVF